MYGISLEGGGSRGAYQIGAWQALNEYNIQYDAVVGTSVGALNAILMVLGKLELGKQIWQSIQIDPVFNSEKANEYRFDDYDFTDLTKDYSKIIKSEGISPQQLKQVIDTVVDEQTIRSLGKKLGVVAINLTDKINEEIFLKDMPKGYLKGYILASCFLPVFKFEKIHGKYYVDGGFYNILPTNMLVKQGYTDIIEIRLGDYATQFPVNDKRLNLITITPSEDLGGTFDFSSQWTKKRIELGYNDTIKELKKHFK